MLSTTLRDTHSQPPVAGRQPLTLFTAWIAANAAGGAIVGALEGGGFQFFATLVLTGPVLGLLQWLVLRRTVGASPWWILLSTLGWFLGTNVSFPVMNAVNAAALSLRDAFGLWEVFWMNSLLEPIVVGVMGLLQWMALRRSPSVALAWTGASLLGGVALGAAGSVVCAAACQPLARMASTTLSGAVSNGAAWMGYAVVTGIALVLLQQRLQAPPARGIGARFPDRSIPETETPRPVDRPRRFGFYIASVRRDWSHRNKQ